MKKNSNVEGESSSDFVFLAKVILGGIVVMGVATVLGVIGNKIMQEMQVISLQEETLQLAEIAQKFVSLEKVFNPQLDTTEFGSKYIASVLPKKYLGDKLTHSLDGEIVVGRSGMSGKEGTELFITLKDIPGEKRCVKLVNLFDKTVPVIAIGEGGSNEVGTKTGMFVKSNYANRLLTKEHLEATCFSLSQKTGSVNITVWVTADTKLMTKKTHP